MLAALPYRDFLVGLGRRPGAPRRGLNPSGGVVWSDAGTVRAELEQRVSCTDVAPLESGEVGPPGDRHPRGAALEPTVSSPDASGVARTRCPGPEIGVSEPLATGSAPRSVLGQHTFKVTMRADRAWNDDGYNVTLHGAVTLTFRTGRITSQVHAFPAS